MRIHVLLICVELKYVRTHAHHGYATKLEYIFQ